MITPELLRARIAAVRAALARGDIGDAMFVLEQLEQLERDVDEPERPDEPKPEPTAIRWGRA